MPRLTLVIGNKNYSSWSMRPWTLMRQLGIEFDEIQIPLWREDSKTRKLAYSPAGRVPVLLDGELAIWDSLAIVEELRERFPEKRIWPAEAVPRARARSLSAEMHSGFESLRSRMPMNVRARKPGNGRGEGVDDDIRRAAEIWRDCREHFGARGDFLFGDFCAADAMFAPVVMRFQTYGGARDRVGARMVGRRGPGAVGDRALRALSQARDALGLQALDRAVDVARERLDRDAVVRQSVGDLVQADLAAPATLARHRQVEARRVGVRGPPPLLALDHETPEGDEADDANRHRRLRDR
jgi:glutathione S-transferase